MHHKMDVEFLKKSVRLVLGHFATGQSAGRPFLPNHSIGSVSEQVLFRDDQPGIQQVKFLENGNKMLAISCANINRKTEDAEGGDLIASVRVRSIPDGHLVCSFEYPFRMIPGIAFRIAVAFDSIQGPISETKSREYSRDFHESEDFSKNVFHKIFSCVEME